MKIIQALIVLFAVIGCLALALGGFFVYNMTREGGDNIFARIQNLNTETPAETTATVVATATPASEYASIIQQYRPTPTPTPIPQVAADGTVVQVAAAPVAATPTARPIETPKPNEGKIRNWPTGRKWVALTYDDGPHREWTPKMVELLKSKNVKATFFFLGQEIERFPEVGKATADAGFEIGNHTMTHPDFNRSAMTPEKIKEELEKTNDLIARHITQDPIRVMRPPYGNTPKKLEAVCEEMGLSIIAWDVDTNDWKRGIESSEMVDNIMKNLKDGSIILMHDKHQKTYDTTAEVIDKIREEGYEFVTMSEMLGLTQYAEAPAPAPAAAPQPVEPQPAAAPSSSLPAPAAAPVVQVAPAASDPSQTLPPVGAGAGASLPAPEASTGPALTGETLDSSRITVPPPTR